MERVIASVEPYWMSTVCRLSLSKNILVVALRKYLDFTTYYVSISGERLLVLYIKEA